MCTKVDDESVSVHYLGIVKKKKKRTLDHYIKDCMIQKINVVINVEDRCSVIPVMEKKYHKCNTLYIR